MPIASGAGYWRALLEDEVKHLDQLIEAFNQQAGTAG
jgi:hypothetical protein